MNFGDLAANQDVAKLPGTTAGTSAGTGNIGEIFQAGIPGGGAIPLTSGVSANVASIALGPGDWEVSGIVNLKYTLATQSADGQAGLNVLSATPFIHVIGAAVVCCQAMVNFHQPTSAETIAKLRRAAARVFRR